VRVIWALGELKKKCNVAINKGEKKWVFLIALMVIPLIALFSLLGGTLVWMAWPSAMQAFPAVVKAGYLVPEISWWSAVCLSFVCGVLVKATQTNNNK
jgi:uncharacterized membrane protein YphA (DoxX/SURF4 family)